MELLDPIVEGLTGLPLWAAWVGIVLATFVSEDLTCIAAGLVAAGGHLAPVHAIGAAGLGIFLGDLGLYWAGHGLGRPALRRRPFSWFVHDEDVELSGEWFKRRGAVVVLLGRFVPGSRLPTYFAAGLLGIGFWRFSWYAFVAVAIWAPLLGGGAMLLGREILPYVELYEQWALPAFALTLLVLWTVTKVLVPACTWRGRRLLVSRWRRVTRWEYWPPWIFYAPVLAQVLRLALRHRSLSVFTAVNPGLPAGGFIGESKSEILEALEGEPELVARTERLPAELELAERVRRARDFLERHELGFPVVLKPDAGQRGSGVAVVRTAGELERYLGEIRVDCVVQEYVSGEEFGLFYYRYPDQPRGRIFSVTRKAFPAVTGDGRSTLEELILRDPRAVCLARRHLEHHAARLWEVPEAGRRVQLVEVGNHCKGAIFSDGAELVTPELEAALERISRRLEGFYFGRYDVCAASLEELRAGRGFKIIELNGATSEATHIYDASFGLLAAYGVLFEQWRILFEIAGVNAARGAKPVPWTELLRQVGRYRVGARSHPG